jgi:hypothetical protein
MRLTGIFAAVILVLSAGCHSSKPDTGAAPAPDAGATLTVENQGFSDMTIYVVSGTTGRVRLGQVVGNTTQSFPIPGYLVRGGDVLRFLARPVGGSRAPVSDELLVSPGDTVTLTIPPQ